MTQKYLSPGHNIVFLERRVVSTLRSVVDYFVYIIWRYLVNYFRTKNWIHRRQIGLVTELHQRTGLVSEVYLIRAILCTIFGPKISTVSYHLVYFVVSDIFVDYFCWLFLLIILWESILQSKAFYTHTRWWK